MKIEAKRISNLKFERTVRPVLKAGRVAKQAACPHANNTCGRYTTWRLKATGICHE
jgi:hypothetical protein